MLTLDKFEEASEKVKEVTTETKLVYSDYFSQQTGNKVYLKPENMLFTGAYKVRRDLSLPPQEITRRVLPMLQNVMDARQSLSCLPQHRSSK